MSLIRCPECHGDVSTKAAVCPHCGYPMSGESTGWSTGSSDPVHTVRRDQEFINLLNAGNLIGSVKRCRELTNLGLKEAKELVEQVAQGQGIQFKNRGGCFIATACYGSVYASEVVLLQDYRDRVLLKSKGGRAFVRFYYAVSPPLASVIARSEALRSWVRHYVVAPIVRRVSRRL